MYVPLAITKVSNAFTKVDAGDIKVPPMSDTASTTKMVEMSTEKISSVNRVRYLTKLDADVIDETRSIPDVQIPVHAYRGRNGRFVLFANWTNVATNANTGPVLPMMVNGCAENNA
jgi:hypothetical protein